MILAEGGGPVTHLRVIHSGGVDIMHEGRLLDLLGPGDAFGHAAMLSGLPPGFEARAAEDTLCYRIPVEVARPLLDRARRSELRSGRTDVNYQPVVKLIRAATVTCKPSENIGFVAERMTAAGVSAAVVELEGGGWGMLTDRDLRARVLAVGRSGAVRVDAAMTAPAYTVSPDRLAGEVLYEMLERGIRHAPVVSERGRLIGMLEDADLYAAQPRSWVRARRNIERSRNLDALSEAAAQLPALMLDLHHSSVPALELAPVLSALVDALTRRAHRAGVGQWRRRRARDRVGLAGQPGAPRADAGLHAARRGHPRPRSCRPHPNGWRPSRRRSRAAGSSGHSWRATRMAGWRAPATTSWRCRSWPTGECCGARRRPLPLAAGPDACRRCSRHSRPARSRRPCRRALTPTPC